ncbi:MAG: hypothetical protein JRN22_02255 [Nitrososphaerota archaeon]|nr:hypothetical protein [Nitrososphaerota archaeon]
MSKVLLALTFFFLAGCGAAVPAPAIINSPALINAPAINEPTMPALFNGLGSWDQPVYHPPIYRPPVLSPGRMVIDVATRFQDQRAPG